MSNYFISKNIVSKTRSILCSTNVTSNYRYIKVNFLVLEIYLEVTVIWNKFDFETLRVDWIYFNLYLKVNDVYQSNHTERCL